MLWPYLLELLVVADYTAAIGIVCRSVHNVITRKQTAGETDCQIDFKTQGLSGLMCQDVINQQVLVIICNYIF